jgi:hypothetical protein
MRSSSAIVLFRRYEVRQSQPQTGSHRGVSLAGQASIWQHMNGNGQLEASESEGGYSYCNWQKQTVDISH